MAASMTDIALVAKMAAHAIARAKSADGRTLTPGPRGLAGEPGQDGAPGKDGKDGKDGRDGIDGKKGTDGKQGERGDKPAHEWIGTGLRFEKPDGTWGETVDLRGQKGARGGGGGSRGETIDIASLAAATNEPPSEFLIMQAGDWVRASYAQMQTWLGSAGAIDGGAASSVYTPDQSLDGGSA